MGNSRFGTKGFWRHINGTAIEPRPFAARSESISEEDWCTKVELPQEKLDAFDMAKSTAMSKIIKSCDAIHQSSIRMIDIPKGAWEKLNFKLNTKADRLQSIHAAIIQQDPAMELPEQWMVMLILLSMNEDYAMEMAIIKAKDTAQSFSAIQARLKEKETALNSDLLSDIIESARKANFGTNQSIH
ncbi:hypothetical protein OnM2_102009 [Erysiphe neolycopersici]|uniref:Uncharacterized protein n=1 Tax=Erysiphe neolycopersici TaxID=212602 RepID=A0A420H8L2_9PEZI|nr:hypothetical protein OnM2_102009 [Erysiphe neolycopersici]